jgi:RNA polymerase sigma factor for flagellar operon FliA
MTLFANGYTQSDDTDAAQRREALVLAHLPQVRVIARRIHDRLPSHISLDDLIAPGIVGLLGAIDNFDPSLNVQLNTYAERRIRGAILDSLREMDWVPRETRKKSRTVEAAIRSLKQTLGREPEAEEIAAELHIPLDEYQAWLTELQSIELEHLEPADNGDPTRALINVLSEDESRWPSRILERAELVRILAQAIDRMPKTERTVLSLYYFEEMSLREIAEIMGLHLSRIGQLRAQAILRLRSHLDRVWIKQPRKRGVR